MFPCTYFSSTKDGVKTVVRQFQETAKKCFNHAKWGDVPTVSGCEKWCHASAVMELTYFKDSFSNIRLEIHLLLRQWDHTDTITNISFHYCICRFKWHIYILSAWELDKQLQQIGWECGGKEDLPEDSTISLGISAQRPHWPCDFCCLPSVALLDSKDCWQPSWIP